MTSHPTGLTIPRECDRLERTSLIWHCDRIRSPHNFLQSKAVGASIEALRRLLSIVLLVVFGLPFVSPLFATTVKSEANLPACCRKNGKHHCMLSVMDRGQVLGHAPQFRAPIEKCPYCPASVAGVHFDDFAAGNDLGIFAGLTSHPAVAAQRQSLWRIARDRSRQKRGPPSPSSQYKTALAAG
jgi:hypothetical protein